EFAVQAGCAGYLKAIILIRRRASILDDQRPLRALGVIAGNRDATDRMPRRDEAVICQIAGNNSRPGKRAAVDGGGTENDHMRQISFACALDKATRRARG